MRWKASLAHASKISPISGCAMYSHLVFYTLDLVGAQPELAEVGPLPL